MISNAEELSVEDIISDKQNEALNKTKSSRPLQFVVEMVPDNIFKSLNSNGLMLQVIFFAIFFGIVLLLIPKDKAKPVITLVDGLNEVFLKMVDLIMRAAPFFVFTLLAGVISKMAGDSPAMVLEIFKALGWYSIVVILGLFIMAFIFYPLLIRLFVPNISYTEFFKKISPAQLLAFSTSSSVATLPVTMDCVQDNLKVPKEITSFVLPIGATVNMDGTSLYQAVAVIFLAQFHMVDLSISQQLVIVLTATLASIGAAAVPSAGLIMMILVLESVGLNPAWIAIVFPIDRLLDMCRTVVNVTGDATVATVIASSEGKIMELDTKD
jgi:Na+/H+-dicarboxylate symporter